MNEHIPHSTRVEYTKGAIDEQTLAASPLEQFLIWFKEAHTEGAHEPNACAIATVGADMQPAVRMVLLKSFDENGFVFFSNYDSRKGMQLSYNNKVAMTFYWPHLERQVRIEGTAQRLSEEENDCYFSSRPRDSQFGSAASLQSRVVASRQVLEQAMHDLRNRVGDGVVPRPAAWGGYRIAPAMIEFWQGRENRLHDRIRYLLQESGAWGIDRLWP
jgi:pyridoxamine 5'-phosphate oxidase